MAELSMYPDCSSSSSPSVPVNWCSIGGQAAELSVYSDCSGSSPSGPVSMISINSSVDSAGSRHSVVMAGVNNPLDLRFSEGVQKAIQLGGPIHALGRTRVAQPSKKRSATNTESNTKKRRVYHTGRS